MRFAKSLFTTINLVCFLCTLAVGVVRAGTYVEAENWSYDKYSESGTLKMYIEKDRMRIEFAGGDRNDVLIYRVENGDARYYMVDDVAEEYARMDDGAIKKMVGMARDQIEQMNEQLSTMSKDQRDDIKMHFRAQIRQAEMMFMAEEADKHFKYEKGEGKEEVGAWKCDHYTANFKGKIYEDVYTVPFEELGITYEDVALLLSLKGPGRGLIGAEVLAAGLRADAAGGAFGMPVRVVMYENGDKMLSSEVKQVRKEDFEETRFEIPKGYDEKDPFSRN